jgi:hypothetical protein
MTGEGWLYLSTVLDVFSRRVVGWAMGPRAKTELVLGSGMGLKEPYTGTSPLVSGEVGEDLTRLSLPVGADPLGGGPGAAGGAAGGRGCGRRAGRADNPR